jgi:exopolyphosphatase/guanosine-5'-triphosphate,3'-diphosphate pyrophosphatase
MKKKAAVIDMGTNTFHLLLVQMGDNQFEILYKEKIAVRIGEGGINQNVLLPNAQKRALHTLTHFQNLIKGEKIDQVFTFATSAVRNAKNASDFTDKILQQIGFKVNIIDGEREAELIYKGIRLSSSLDQNTSLMMDIGGGSVEFIIGNEETIFWKKSFEIGGQRMLDRFHYHDPILEEEVDKLYGYLESELTSLISAIKKYSPTRLIGASGTFDTLSDMYLASLYLERSRDIQSHFLPIQDFQSIADKLIRLNKQERLKIPGMIPMRVDMIVVASCLIQYILKYIETPTLICSTYSLKEGVIAELMEKVESGVNISV